ncbi:hypothetical protein Bca52824_027268 [Brassica carinata]|uniref:Integrase zinc-binding domain-containing protein n=1 Tax=Brassica carinata TaxID=52824 RepID=A0A8X7SJ58_BRACI|nr:hypothetical protein Bca52824_027268 [Brassica carinata]
MALSVEDCDLLKHIQSSYEKDPLTKSLIEELEKKPDARKHFSWVQRNLRRKSKLVIPCVAELRETILKWLHGSGTSGHSGRDATHQRVKSLFYWKGMIVSDVVIKEPFKILERKMVKRQGKAATQVLLQWTNQGEEVATWEFLFDLQRKFPSFEPCGQGSSNRGDLL